MTSPALVLLAGLATFASPRAPPAALLTVTYPSFTIFVSADLARGNKGVKEERQREMGQRNEGRRKSQQKQAVQQHSCRHANKYKILSCS